MQVKVAGKILFC